jgi:hypothetical protein
MSAHERLKAKVDGMKKAIEVFEKNIGQLITAYKRCDKALIELNEKLEIHIAKLERPWWKKLLRIGR